MDAMAADRHVGLRAEPVAEIRPFHRQHISLGSDGGADIGDTRHDHSVIHRVDMGPPDTVIVEDCSKRPIQDNSQGVVGMVLPKHPGGPNQSSYRGGRMGGRGGSPGSGGCPAGGAGARPGPAVTRMCLANSALRPV